jgi:hypothetical protein
VPVKPGNGHLAFIFRRKKDGQILDPYANLLFPAMDPFLVLFERDSPFLILLKCPGLAAGGDGGKSRYSCDSIGRMPRNPIPSRFQNPV